MIRRVSFRRFAWLWMPTALALLARLLVAPGWMVDADTSRVLTVRLCSDVSSPGKTVEISFKRSGDPQPEDAEYCPWTALADAATPPTLFGVAAQSLAATAIAVRPAGTGAALGAASRLPPSTGPPLIV